MYCYKCGNEIDDDSVFCTFCGSKQNKELEELDKISGTTIIDNNGNRSSLKVELINHSPKGNHTKTIVFTLFILIGVITLILVLNNKSMLFNTLNKGKDILTNEANNINKLNQINDNEGNNRIATPIEKAPLKKEEYGEPYYANTSSVDRQEIVDNIENNVDEINQIGNQLWRPENENLPIINGQTWYAGSWNSEYTSNMLDTHPLNIILRIEVFDSDSKMRIKNAEVSLEGNYYEITKTYNDEIKTEKEFKLVAYSNEEGIAVFALRWNKPYAHYRIDEELDDFEKVQRITVKSSGYNYFEQKFILGLAKNFNQGLDKSSIWNKWYEAYGGKGWDDWKKEVSTMVNARYFQLSTVGSDFNDYNNENCIHPIVFEKVKNKKFDFEWPNMSNMLNNPPNNVGPFIMIPIVINQVRIEDTFGSLPFRENKPDNNIIKKEINSTIPPNEIPKSNIIVPNGLIVFYSFDGGATDYSGNNYLGIVSGARLTIDHSSKSNSAFVFDGVDDYIEISNSQGINLSTQISISFWAKFESGSPYYYPYHIIEKHGCWGLGQRENDLACGISTTIGDFNVWVNNFEFNKFHHIVMTYDGSKLSCYLNGVLKGSIPASGLIKTNTNKVFIGKYTLGGDYFFDGTIDNIRIYDRALTSQEINALYNE
jgi:hypothetical protein